MNFMFRLEKPLAPGLYKINDQNLVGFEIAKPTDCIKRVIFNDPEKGLAMCIAKRAMGNSGNYYNIFKKFLPKKKQESVVYPEAAIANVDQISTMVIGDIKNDLNKAEELYSKILNAIKKYASIDEIKKNVNLEDKEGLNT